MSHSVWSLSVLNEKKCQNFNFSPKTTLPVASEFVKAHRPRRPRNNITYRELNRIDEDRFLTNLLALPLFTSTASDINDLVSQYNSGLSLLLNSHAPVRTRVVTVRLSEIPPVFSLS